MYFDEWGMIVGDRVRRLRLERRWTLGDLAEVVERPDGAQYGYSYFSKLERGIAYAPLQTYVAVADALSVHPGRLLGPDDAFRDVTEGEMTLVAVVRELGLDPVEAIVRLLKHRDS